MRVPYDLSVKNKYYRMKKNIYIFFLSSIALSLQAQDMGIKSNVLYDATTTFSLGAELGLGNKTSMDISGAYNPWEFSPTKRMKMWMIQPEFRYWPCEGFYGHFFGLHAHGGQYNFSGINFSDNMKKYNYQGDFYGAGMSYGYQWIMNNRWGIEASLGAGFIYFKYDKYPCAECGSKLESDSKNYWGPTKAGVSLIYFIF